MDATILKCGEETNRQLDELLSSLSTILSDNLLGVYLHGSLAMGCFNPQRSDIDVLVLTHKRLEVETKRDLMQAMLSLSLRPSPIEISFLNKIDLFPWTHP